MLLHEMRPSTVFTVLEHVQQQAGSTEPPSITITANVDGQTYTGKGESER